MRGVNLDKASLAFFTQKELGLADGALSAIFFQEHSAEGLFAGFCVGNVRSADLPSPEGRDQPAPDIDQGGRLEAAVSNDVIDKGRARPAHDESAAPRIKPLDQREP